MLKMISCYKFVSNGVWRGPIYFHRGLNTVLGTSSGTNSIGKSTFLMIIDFVFGGNDYLEKKTKEVLDENKVGHHEFEFVFEFDGVDYFYIRSTATPNKVTVCNEAFLPVKEITLDQFRSELADRYGLTACGITLRDAIGPFMRIYHRETTNEERPLIAATNERVEDSIKRFLKLYGKYDVVSDEDKRRKSAADQEAAMKKGMQYEQVRSAKGKKEYQDNAAKIKELEDKLSALAEDSDNGILDLDSLQAEQIAEINSKLSRLRKQRTRISSQLNSMKEGVSPARKSTNDFTPLKKFFPNANIRMIEEIEAFHQEISAILNDEYSENVESLETMLGVLKDKISALEGAKMNLRNVPNVSSAVLNEYARINKEIDILKQENSNFEKYNELRENHKIEEGRYKKIVAEQTSFLVDQINPEMKRINDEIYQGRKTSPTLSIESYKRYDFSVINDTGTGSQYRGLIIFDLCVLNETPLPVVVHDSIILKNLEDVALTAILKLYSESNKQVFIAYDKAESFGPEAEHILNDSAVIRLSGEGNQLFGTSWGESR